MGFHDCIVFCCMGVPVFISPPLNIYIDICYLYLLFSMLWWEMNILVSKFCAQILLLKDVFLDVELLAQKLYFKALMSTFIYFFKFIYFKERERERECVCVWAAEGQREMETERDSQAGSALSAWSLMQGLIPWAMGSRPELKPRVRCLTYCATQAPL